MAASKRYRALKRAVGKLRRALLPRNFDPTGSYRGAERVHLRAISFRILVHAEVEFYLEDRALELLTSAWSQWQSARVPSDPILGLLAYGGVETVLPPRKLGGDPENQEAYDDVEEPLKRAQNVWRATHKRNHGIKEENVLALLLPLGIRADDVDTTLLADLSSFGGARGEVAHRSAVGTTKRADPKDELDRANGLVDDLLSLDDVLSKAVDQVGRFAKAVAP